mgnify:CR=1 FL=1
MWLLSHYQKTTVYVSKHRIILKNRLTNESPQCVEGEKKLDVKSVLEFEELFFFFFFHKPFPSSLFCKLMWFYCALKTPQSQVEEFYLLLIRSITLPLTCLYFSPLAKCCVSEWIMFCIIGGSDLKHRFPPNSGSTAIRIKWKA